jgi:single-stranded DNA-binding protein
MISASLKGNVLANPVQKTVSVKGQEVKITELRIMSDVWRKQGDEMVQDESKTSPVQVTIWNERLAEKVAAVVRSGMRVEARGDLWLQRNPATEEERNQGKRDYADLRMDADDLCLALNRVEAITMRQKADPAAQP